MVFPSLAKTSFVSLPKVTCWAAFCPVQLLFVCPERLGLVNTAQESLSRGLYKPRTKTWGLPKKLVRGVLA